MNRITTFVMTRERTWVLTAISVALFILLCWIFADGLLTAAPVECRGLDLLAADHLPADRWRSSWPGGIRRSSIPSEGIALRPAERLHDPRSGRGPGRLAAADGQHLLRPLLAAGALLRRARLALRRAGTRSSIRPGRRAATALQAYWERAVAIPESGRPPITYDWFRQFLQYMLDNGWYTWFAKLVAWGEVLVGLGLLVGALVGIAAFFGTVMNFSFMLAGSASTNPVLFGLAVFLVLAWKVAGYWGLDRWLLPALGTPWQRGRCWAASRPWR